MNEKGSSRWCVIRKVTSISPVVYKYSISEKRHSPREQQNELSVLETKPALFENSVARSQKLLLGQSTGIPESLYPLQLGKQNSKNSEITIRIPLQITTENTNGREFWLLVLDRRSRMGERREAFPLRSGGRVAQRAVDL